MAVCRREREIGFGGTGVDIAHPFGLLRVFLVVPRRSPGGAFLRALKSGELQSVH